MLLSALLTLSSHSDVGERICRTNGTQPVRSCESLVQDDLLFFMTCFENTRMARMAGCAPDKRIDSAGTGSIPRAPRTMPASSGSGGRDGSHRAIQ